MSVDDYSTTPASNTSISGINIDEGCSPGGINNAIRQLMADIKVFKDATGTNADITAIQADITALENDKAPINSPTFTGEVGINDLRMLVPGIVTLTSTAHPLQIGSSSGQNLRYDNRRIQAVNNGAADALLLNPSGGNVEITNASGTATAKGNLQVDGNLTVTGSFPQTVPTAGSINSPVLCKNVSGSDIGLNGTVSGANLRPAGILGLGTFDSGPATTETGAALSGTWRCHGECPDDHVSLFIRIA